MGTGAAARVERPRLQQRPHLAQRPAKLPVATPSDPRLPGIRPVQAKDQPHGGGLARAVRPQEAGHHPRPYVEAEPVDGDSGAIAFAEPANLDPVQPPFSLGSSRYDPPRPARTRLPPLLAPGVFPRLSSLPPAEPPGTFRPSPSREEDP